MKPCVWLRMENRVFQKIIYFDYKIAPLTWKIFSTSVLPSNHFQIRAKRERERERPHRHANKESSRSRHRVRDRTSQIAVLVPSTQRWDRTTNPWTDRPTSSTAEIAPRTHEPIIVLVPFTRQLDCATNPQTDQTHPSSSSTNPRTNRSTIGLVILIFFCFDFCFLFIYFDSL